MQIHASELGCIDSPNVDQFSEFKDAVQHCIDNNLALDIEGLEIRVGKQSTSDDTYKYVASQPGTARTYAILLPVDARFVLTGNGTIGNLNSDDNQVIFHGVNCRYVEIGDGVTLDCNNTKSGWGGTLHLMGCEKLHLGRCTFMRDQACRFGASTTRRSGTLTATQPRFIDGWGNHCIGGKPGGFEEIYADTLYFENVRGCINLETEDEDNLNDDGTGQPLWDTDIVGRINLIVTDQVNGDKDPAAAPVQASGLVVQDCEGSKISVGGIIARNHTSSTGNADALYVAGGQTNKPAASVDVGYIAAENVRQAFRYSGTEKGGEKVSIDWISGSNIDQIVKIRATTPPANDPTPSPPEGLKLLHIGLIDVEQCDEAFSVFNYSAAFSGNIIDRLSIQECRLGVCVNSAGYAEAVGDLILGDYSWGDVTTFKSGQPYGNWAMYLKADRVLIKTRLRSENSHNRFLYVNTADYADLRGIDQITALAGGGVGLEGSGKVYLRDSQIRATGGGVAILEVGSFTNSIDMLNVNLNGNGVASSVTIGAQVNYIP